MDTAAAAVADTAEDATAVAGMAAAAEDTAVEETAALILGAGK